MTGQAYSGFTRTNVEPFDFYKTPPEATRALLLRETFEGEIWEPCSGDGAISKILEEDYFDVVSSDIQVADYVHGEQGVDFLKSDHKTENIVTNPPYNLAQECVEHALTRAARKVAMLLPLSFLESQGRYELLVNSPLKSVYVFSKRIRCRRLSDPDDVKLPTGTVFAWFVWDHGHTGKPTLGWVSPSEVA